MSIDILVTREGQRLVPYDQLSADMIEALPAGTHMVTVTKKRSLPHNRLYFQCIRDIVEGQGGTIDDLHNATKIKCGLYVIADYSDGPVVVPNSTAFNKMDQNAFNPYFEKAVAWWKSSGLWEWIRPELREKIEVGK